jgi:hypothetical protein
MIQDISFACHSHYQMIRICKTETRDDIIYDKYDEYHQISQGITEDVFFSYMSKIIFLMQNPIKKIDTVFRRQMWYKMCLSGIDKTG